MAALELWLTKATAKESDNEDQDKRGRLTPELLRLIEAAIQVVSGHSPETLLQDKGKRLEFTAAWVLEQLSDYHSADKTHQAGFKRISENLQEIMQMIADELMEE
jgi:hypothetical protein